MAGGSHGAVRGERWFDRVARVGYASKGAVFGVVGGLAMGRAVGMAREAVHREIDNEGAVHGSLEEA